MSPDLQSTLFKLGLPLLIIVFVLVVTRLRGLSWAEDLGLALPSARRAALWIGL
jgi:hypothetical protein